MGNFQRIEGDGWKQAREEYKEVASDLRARRKPRAK
jgi:hypothetical protein